MIIIIIIRNSGRSLMSTTTLFCFISLLYLYKKEYHIPSFPHFLLSFIHSAAKVFHSLHLHPSTSTHNYLFPSPSLLIYIQAPFREHIKKKMALNQYFEEAVPQMDSLEDKSSLEMWKRASADATSDSDRNGSSGFDCNICLECVQDPVVTLCGHLYCWPCIYKWLNSHSISYENEEKQKPQCPVCKSEISESSLVPLYGRGQTTSPSKDKARQVGSVIPRRPLGPSWMTNLPRSLDTATFSQHTSQVYHPRYPNHPPHYTSPMVNTGGSFDTTYGVFGEMIYARIFGNQVTNIYTYPNSYDLSGISNPRIRRHLMRADKSLSRICFFLLCCTILCLLLF